MTHTDTITVTHPDGEAENFDSLEDALEVVEYEWIQRAPAGRPFPLYTDGDYPMPLHVPSPVPGSTIGWTVAQGVA